MRFRHYVGLALILFILIYVIWISGNQRSIPVIMKGNDVKGADTYIITEKAVLSRLQLRSQLITLEQTLNKEQTLVDDNFFGERKTKLVVKGTVRMGVDMTKIHVIDIDTKERAVTLELPKPTLISLEIPYDKITFDKTSGWLRGSMDNKEKKEFYSTVEKALRNELTGDKGLLKQVELCNQDAVRTWLTAVGVKNVYFK